MPTKEISAESVRDKSIRHGHISTLHLWWARRPLPVCRAVVFASLVPDPLDENCPKAFRDAVELILGKHADQVDFYSPYKDIPWTSAKDPMEDNLRNRLQMFIGKFTTEMQEHLLHNKSRPSAGRQLANSSLIKWDNKNNEIIINKARKLIWVAHNSKKKPDVTASELLTDFDKHYHAIKEAEKALYSMPDRHLDTEAVQQATVRLEQAKMAFLDKMPQVFDPFAGGGAIPLEAARLGCRSYGNDVNPVAHIIQRGSLEFPQKYGKPIVYSKKEFVKRYGQETWNTLDGRQLVHQNGEAIGARIDNRLSFDVAFYAKKLLKEAEKEIGHYYPADEKGNKPIAYYWARVGTCNNPTCKAEVPLLKGFYLANTKSKKVYLHPIIRGKQIDFEIRRGTCNLDGWNKRTNITCPICGSITDTSTLKQQFIRKETKEKLLAVIEEGPRSKIYRLPTNAELSIIERIPEINRSPFQSKMQIGNNRNFNSPGWGIDDYADMFSPRQLLALQTLVQKLQEIKATLQPDKDDYAKAVVTYLGILLDRGTAISTSFGRWDVSREGVQSPFSKQAIPMIFDYPEAYLLGKGMGSLRNQLEWITRYIESESDSPFSSQLQNASSGEKSQFAAKSLTAVVTDPPYYDAIAYADLSDFFYVWLKRTLGDLYPLNFATPQTPKSEECTALKHHHGNSKDDAKTHFEKKLTQIFDAIEHQTSDIVSIMFAHQSTEAWTTLCNSILDARMNITGSWAIDTEMANRSLGLAGAALESSVTVSCQPSQRRGVGSYRDVKRAIQHTVTEEVSMLYKLGFRGADLLTACFGKAVSEFGQYQRVEKADGSDVSVAELLEMAREAAFNALLKGFDGDEVTKFYIGWLQLFGFSESDFDDAAKFSRVGLSINVDELFRQHILIKNGNKQTLASYNDRVSVSKTLGEKADSNLIDQVHRAMMLYKGTDREALLFYIKERASQPDGSFWRVITSICEVLPQSSDDYTQASGLLTNKDSLIRESRAISKSGMEQTRLFEY